MGCVDRQTALSKDRSAAGRCDGRKRYGKRDVRHDAGGRASRRWLERPDVRRSTAAHDERGARHGAERAIARETLRRAVAGGDDDDPRDRFRPLARYRIASVQGFGCGPKRVSNRMARLVWFVVLVVTALRAIAAARLPLTGDEAYYWEWSRHLAAGYTDHPPAVAYAIVVFAWLGRSPFAVRIAFVLCGLFATLVAAATATRLADGDPRAGRVTALA